MRNYAKSATGALLPRIVTDFGGGSLPSIAFTPSTGDVLGRPAIFSACTAAADSKLKLWEITWRMCEDGADDRNVRYASS